MCVQEGMSADVTNTQSLVSHTAGMMHESAAAESDLADSAPTDSPAPADDTKAPQQAPSHPLWGSNVTIDPLSNGQGHKEAPSKTHGGPLDPFLAFEQPQGRAGLPAASRGSELQAMGGQGAASGLSDPLGDLWADRSEQ